MYRVQEDRMAASNVRVHSIDDQNILLQSIPPIMVNVLFGRASLIFGLIGVYGAVAFGRGYDVDRIECKL